MKRLVVVLSGLLVLPAFAEVAPVYYDEVVEYSDAEMIPSDDVVSDEFAETEAVAAPVVANKVSSRAPGRAASRAIPTGQSGVTARNVTGRGTTSRATVARTATTTPAASRAANSRMARTAAITSSVAPKGVTARRATLAAKPATAARASIVQTDTVNQPLYSGRVGVSARMSGMRSRAPVTTTTATTTSTDVVTATAAETVAAADELAQLTDYCKAQYTQCMDNYCDVLDENQGRCSCSKNLKNYEKTEEALKAATQALQDVAQQIQYIGLTGDQIETLFTQTEAEVAMQSNTDNTQLKNLISKIGENLVEVKSGAASTSTSGLALDFSGVMEGIDFGAGNFDLSIFTGGTNTASINNQRGETLYKTAAARCKASVLNTCSAQGVDVSVITNSYDLEIDKQCLVYERSLEEANENMTNTVRNARAVLQRARLMVDQQKNQFNLLECVQELDKCMQSEFVCGSDYEECLDPTGKYIVNNAVVVGSEPGVSGGTGTTGLYATWTYAPSGGTGISPWASSGNVDDYIAEYLGEDSDEDNAGNMAVYLQEKIGYIQDGRAYGMCSGVLNQCRQYTYSTDKGKDDEYQKDNKVVQEYLKRTLLKIKAAQDEVLADYADGCIEEVTTCLGNNGVSVSSVMAKKACRSIATTCASVYGDGLDADAILDLASSQSATAKVEYDFEQSCAGGFVEDFDEEVDFPKYDTLTLPGERMVKDKNPDKIEHKWKYLCTTNAAGVCYLEFGDTVQVTGDMKFTLTCRVPDSTAGN